MWSVHAGPVFPHCNFEISVQRSVPDTGVQQDTECGITPILNVFFQIHLILLLPIIHLDSSW